MAVTANSFKEVEVTDWVLASLLSYAGYPVVKCVSSGRSTDTVWTFRGVPSEDLKIYQEEITRPDTSVMLTSFIAAQKAIQHTQAQAKKNMGVFTGDQYAKL